MSLSLIYFSSLVLTRDLEIGFDFNKSFDSNHHLRFSAILISLKKSLNFFSILYYKNISHFNHSDCARCVKTRIKLI